MGWIPLLGSLGIAIGYSVIIGWVLRFLCGSVTNTVLEQDSAEYFADVTAFMGNVPWARTCNCNYCNLCFSLVRLRRLRKQIRY